MPFLESDRMFAQNGLMGNCYYRSNITLFKFYDYHFTNITCTEWISYFCVCRGFPVWLHHIPGIEFRTYNQPFMVIYMIHK